MRKTIHLGECNEVLHQLIRNIYCAEKFLTVFISFLFDSDLRSGEGGATFLIKGKTLVDTHPDLSIWGTLSCIDFPPEGDTFSPSMLLGERSLVGVAALRSSGFPSSMLVAKIGIGNGVVGRWVNGSAGNGGGCGSSQATEINNQNVSIKYEKN